MKWEVGCIRNEVERMRMAAATVAAERMAAATVAATLFVFSFYVNRTHFISVPTSITRATLQTLITLATLSMH